MKQLLSAKTVRLLNIAEVILIKGETISIASIAIMNSCSLKTVNDDLKYLNENWNPIIELNYNHSLISSNNTSCYDFIDLKRNLYKLEIKIQLLLQIFLHPNLELLDYAEMLSYSESHLRRQIKPINEFLKEFSTEIEYNAKTYQYKLCASNLIHQSFLITKIITESLNTSLLDIDETDEYTDYINSLSLKLTRQGKNELSVLSKVINHSEKTGFDMLETKTQIKETYFKIQNQRFIIQTELKAHNIQNNCELNTQEEKEAIDLIIMITCKAILFPFKVDHQWNRYDYFLLNFTKWNKKAIAIFNELIIKLSKTQKVNYLTYKSELAFDLFTMVDGFINPLPYKIGIYSDLGSSHARSLVTSCQSHFSTHSIEIYEETKKYDLILSTRTLRNNNKNTIKVSDTIRISEIKKINQFFKMH